jgi:hypothetical protein
MLNPGTAALLLIVGGVGTVATFTGFDIAQKVGPQLEPKDILPMPPPYPPLPRFIYEKPEVLDSLKR